MIAVSPEFAAAQLADAAAYTAQFWMILGNYAAAAAGATITSSGDDASGNYPAAGMIDGDRTEINIGAPTAADNGVGLSSWKSSATPDGSGNVWAVIAFNATRTFNRVKLYNLAADPLTSYVIQYWNGAAWVTFAGTPDKYTPPPGSLGTGGYGTSGSGLGPYGGSPWPNGGPTGGLDFYDFPDISSTKIKLIVYATKNADAAQVVELMVYRKIDITSRVTSVKQDRKKDLKLANPMATQLDLVLDNTDQFWSLDYAPTAAQAAAGYVNPELSALGIDVETWEGFITFNGPERIRTFTGSLDTITGNVLTATAPVTARDGIKHLINNQDSSNVKTAIDIADAIRYVLNRNNVSNYEMALTTTGITQDYFFYYETQMLTVLQELVLAAGDAIFFFDENGIATFKFYLNSVPNNTTTSGQTGWQAGSSLTNCIALGGLLQREWFLIDDFADGNYTVNPTWTFSNGGGSGTASAASHNLVVTAGSGNTRIYTPLTPAAGTWADNIQASLSAHGSSGEPPHTNSIQVQFMRDGSGNGYALLWLNTDDPSYSSYSGHVVLAAVTSGGTAWSVLADLGAYDGSSHAWIVERDGSGNFTVYKDGISVGTATDSTYNASVNFYVGIASATGTDSVTIGGIYYSPALTNAATTNAQAVWISPNIDQGAAITAEGTFQATYNAPAGTTVTFQTRTSATGTGGWSPWLTIVPGTTIASPVQRYLQVQIILAAPEDDGAHNANLTTPTVTQLVGNWYFGTGDQKWSPTVNFFLTDSSGLLDLQQQVSDNLGGDTAIINDVAVTATPLLIGGSVTDVVWQGTTNLLGSGGGGLAISGSNPLSVTVGTYYLNCTISGGVDTSGMSGAGAGTAIAVTFGTATGSVSMSYIHPTKPIIKLVVTGNGTITNLQITAKSFQSATTPYINTAADAISQNKHNRRHADVGNNYIVNGNIGGIIATKTIANFKNPTKWIPKASVTPLLNLQPVDRINVNNELTGLRSDYYAIGYTRTIAVDKGGSAKASMDLQLLVVPTS